MFVMIEGLKGGRGGGGRALDSFTRALKAVSFAAPGLESNTLSTQDPLPMNYPDPKGLGLLEFLGFLRFFQACKGSLGS